MIDITIDKNVFHGFLFYTGVLVLKTMLMSLLTTRMRFMKRVWSSPEDIDAAIKLKIPSPSLKYDDEHVERVRRAHLNDLENIPMFIFSGFVYALSQPNPSVALTLFRIYALARILHTVVYAIYVVPQPARAIFHVISYFIAIYMTIVGLIMFFRP
ncbi:hypothetical protein V9T40_002050 [Parthenolecanium corni]|uniref:Microsomal glutathione S-transferase 1 n=1 Tax=Parthenolecanium corni TaxID=536013 RepID=A0AAN9TFK2_9HEMI